MLIKFHEIKNLKIENNNFYLFYGTNSGLIEETVNKIFKPKLSKNIITYEENEIFNKINEFKETIFNKSFFDSDKLIIIKRSTDKILDLIKEILEKNPADIKFLILSAILDKKSKLRNFFEKNKHTIVIPFYEDNHQSLLFLVQNFLDNKKIKLSNENINFLIERSKGNRINLFNELEKILSYSKNKKIINSEDIIKLTNLAENYNIADLVNYSLAKNKKKTINILNENNLNLEENILILRTFLNKLKRLKSLKIDLEKNKNIEQVLSSSKPPIFWKDKLIIKQQLEVLSLAEIQNLILKVNNLELEIKKNYQISDQILNNFILENLISANNAI
jgi:DNA polymerase-3 subunit delta